jgi:hypothetical protein
MKSKPQASRAGCDGAAFARLMTRTRKSRALSENSMQRLRYIGTGIQCAFVILDDVG